METPCGFESRRPHSFCSIAKGRTASKVKNEVVKMGVPTFVAYIDESGDEGFRFESGSSHWFVLSAFVLPKTRDLEMVAMVREIRLLLGKPDEHTLHFRKLNHDQRVALAGRLAKFPCCAISIAVHKPSLSSPEGFQDAYRLYHYTVRFLLERVGWYCRDNRPYPAHGDGTVDLVFSNRKRMSYEAIKNYIELLLINSRIEFDGEPILDIRLESNIINPNQITAPAAGSKAGLQMADAIASSCYFGFQTSHYGTIEPRYLTILKPIVYCRKGNYLSYGLKCFPVGKDGMEKINADLRWVGDIFG